MPPLDSLAARIRGEYREMPGLRLTFAQACRLWQVDASTCETLLDNGAYIAQGETSGRQAKAQLRQRVMLPRSA
jgi:hypothetical protein